MPHVWNKVTKEAAKRNTNRSGREDDHTETAFISAIPEDDVEDDTEENTALGSAKNGANDVRKERQSIK